MGLYRDADGNLKDSGGGGQQANGAPPPAAPPAQPMGPAATGAAKPVGSMYGAATPAAPTMTPLSPTGSPTSNQQLVASRPSQPAQAAQQAQMQRAATVPRQSTFGAAPPAPNTMQGAAMGQAGKIAPQRPVTREQPWGGPQNFGNEINGLFASPEAQPPQEGSSVNAAAIQANDIQGQPIEQSKGRFEETRPVPPDMQSFGSPQDLERMRQRQDEILQGGAAPPMRRLY